MCKEKKKHGKMKLSDNRKDVTLGCQEKPPDN